jgi:hypothetical protein
VARSISPGDGTIPKLSMMFVTQVVQVETAAWSLVADGSKFRTQSATVCSARLSLVVLVPVPVAPVVVVTVLLLPLEESTMITTTATTTELETISRPRIDMPDHQARARLATAARSPEPGDAEVGGPTEPDGSAPARSAAAVGGGVDSATSLIIGSLCFRASH